MDFFMTHTYESKLNAIYMVVPKWWVNENPAEQRIVMIIKTDIVVDWGSSYSSPST